MVFSMCMMLGSLWWLRLRMECIAMRPVPWLHPKPRLPPATRAINIWWRFANGETALYLDDEAASRCAYVKSAVMELSCLTVCFTA